MIRRAAEGDGDALTTCNRPTPNLSGAIKHGAVWFPDEWLDDQVATQLALLRLLARCLRRQVGQEGSFENWSQNLFSAPFCKMVAVAIQNYTIKRDLITAVARI